MSNTEKLDNLLIIHMIVAIGIHPPCSSEIDKVYMKDKANYRKKYTQSNMYRHNYFNLYPTNKFIRIEKMAGIFIDCFDNNDYNKVISIARKGYNSIYQHVKKSDVIDVPKVLNIFSNGKELESLSPDTFIDAYTLIQLFNMKYKKPIRDHEVYNALIESFVREKDLISQIINEQDSVLDEYFDENESEARELYRDFSIREAEHNIGSLLKLTNKRYDSDAAFRSKMKGYYEGYNLFSGVYKGLGINEELLDQDIPKKDILRIFGLYSELLEYNDIPKHVHNYMLGPLFLSMALHKEYSNTRELAINTSFNPIRIDGKSTDKHKDAIKNISQNRDKWRKKYHSSKHMLNSSRKENDVLIRENKRLKDNLRTANENEKELVALREHIFRLQQGSPDVLKGNDIDQRDMGINKNKLKKLDIVIVGGHGNWVTKMKRTFPDFTYIDGSFDLTILDRPDIHVFFNTDSNSHSQYNKVTSTMNKNNGSFHFMSNLTNIDRTVDFMIDVLNI